MNGTCRIPNREVRSEWVNSIEGIGEYSAIIPMIRNSKELLESVWHGDCKTVADALTRTHEHLTRHTKEHSCVIEKA